MYNLQKEGLYDPAFEHDGCGVGFVVNIKGNKSHDIIENGIKIVENLTHRGASGCDPRTGDGAGILMQIPDEFFRKECRAGNHISGGDGFELPKAGEYGVGMVFFPQIPEDRHICEGIFEEVIEEEGLKLLGWRTVPVNNEYIGEFARDVEPRMKQVFIAKGQDIKDQDHFERKLYVIRKRVQFEIRHQMPRTFHYFYIVSLSTRTIVYKGMLIAEQIRPYYKDLSNPSLKSAIALVHQRYSTNTFPTWDLAHPFRYLCHNGEINTLRGNLNWMQAREKIITSDLFGEDIKKIMPIVKSMGSDSALLDNMFEFLVLSGRSLAHSMLMLIPEAWTGDPNITPEKRGFYEFHAAIMEPWDGPASIAFSDGRSVGAILDRNGLRPSRYIVTNKDIVVMASETGVLDIPEKDIIYKGRLQPGKIFLVDTEQGRIIDDGEIKNTLCTRKPYKKWVEDKKIDLSKLSDPPPSQPPIPGAIIERQKIFGYTIEELNNILKPMAENSKEPVGSMGVDIPIAVLSKKPQLLYNYFKQLFAQVTNPAIDPIREELVMSLVTYVGGEGNLLDEYPEQCHQIELPHPILTNNQIEKIRHFSIHHFRSITLPLLYHQAEGGKRLEYALNELCDRASESVKAGYSILILSDKGVDAFRAPIPALLAVGAVHQRLIKEGTRSKVGIIVETGEPREVMHFCLLLGYGASAVNPYLAFETISDMVCSKKLSADISEKTAHNNFINAINKGILKVMSKMGISTLLSYHGAQIFEAIGISEEIVDKYFTGTPSRIGGIGLDIIAEETRKRHEEAFPKKISRNKRLSQGTRHQWRKGGEEHLLDPNAIDLLRKAVFTGNYDKYKEFSKYINSKTVTLRSLLKFKECNPIPIKEVEPIEKIVKRFVSGAMSFGSISREAHQTLAIAMNRLGGKSNSGEGGEDPERFKPLPNGDSLCSATKQVASGRFGATTEYLVNSKEIQIKISQGAKPGEGGQLPGHKVSAEIAGVRYSTPGVGLISPPPHHDIYSIEDLAQLIFDLKNVNPEARINVKLVSECGVGTVAAGVSKGKADAILISGYDGGTGASPVSSIHHAGVPWELGLSETHQVLVKNDLRSRIILQVDGKLCTGRDIATAALLGAEEYGFSTVPLMTMGCVMMRKCHLNTCSVGVATQNPDLRKKFIGKPEYIINYFNFVARELREIMSELGIRTVDEMIGKVEYLKVKDTIKDEKLKLIDFSKILYKQRVPKFMGTKHIYEQEHGIDDILDKKLIELSAPALESKKRVVESLPIRNVNRTVGAMLSGKIAKKFGHKGLPDDTIHFSFRGSAGQSFGAWGARGLTLELEGDANDYLGKGLSGAKIIVKPDRESGIIPEVNIIVGNVVLYGAIDGECYIRGLAGERFAVRNSGAYAVVEGVGDHGCEYMTGGRVVVIGPVGKNFAAGMSGGLAYVYDLNNKFETLCNRTMVYIESLRDEDINTIKSLLSNHYKYTASTVAKKILDNWNTELKKFIKVFPKDYKKVMEEDRNKKD